MIISGQLTQDMIPDMELGTTHYALSVSIYQNLLKGRWLLRVRENGGSLDFNFISLPNPAVDENWVCWHHLKQFIPGKWCHIQWFDLFKLFVNGILPEHFHFFLCVYGYTFCLFYRSSATFKLLHHFGFVCSRWCCTHFSYQWCRIVMFHVS